MSHPVCYTRRMKNMKQVNTTNENIILACGEETKRNAEVRFRQLQHEAGRGTTESDYAKLERFWRVRKVNR